MSRTILHSELLNPIFVSITVIILSEAIAQASPTARETPKLLQSQTDTLSLESALALDSSTSTPHSLDTWERQTRSPVPSVNQLWDVQPTDWAFQALQSLVERYGCIAAYRDHTFKGNRTLTRYEFAAGLNACLDRITELLNNATTNLATRHDTVLQRLQEEFAPELASIRGQVLALESRTAELEADQFSTTTQLSGEVIFLIGDSFGDRALYNAAGGPNTDEKDDPTQTYFGYRARLNFDTSFTGRDLLRIRLEAKDFPRLRDDRLNNTLMTRTGIDGDTDGFELDKLFYRFPLVNGRAQVLIGVKGLDLDDPVSPLRSSGSGAASRFGRYNPTSFRGPDGTGIGVKYAVNDHIQVNAAYLASDGDGPDARTGRGIFDGSHSALVHVLFEPSDRISMGLEYSHYYFRDGGVNLTGGTGSFIANRPFGNWATTSDNLGVQINWEVFNNFELGGWFGSTWADQKRDGDDEATIVNWGVTLAFPDVIREGDLGGIIVGMPPKVVDHDLSELEDQDTSIHVEAFYRFQLNDHIGIIPGFFIITNPDHNSNNDTTWVGTFRTQFRF